VTDPKLTEGRGPAQAGEVAGEAGDLRPENRGAEGAAGGSVPREEEHVSAELIAELERERDEYLDSLQRLKAEFDNFRKRTARESAAQSARAGEALVKELLPVLDDLERALVAAEKHEEAKLEEGVRLVHRALADVLARAGLSEIETGGAFDPHVHEALLAQPVEGADAGAVVEVLQKGYRLGDRVLRPARVVVAQ
jgi:molecular chaperone GrpE